MANEINRDAALSECERYRYALWRRWSEGKGILLFVGLNPSTADAHVDDATVRRCVGFAKRWGFGAVALANLFALRSRDPRLLGQVEDPIGPENDRWIDQLASSADAVVASWGTRGELHGRGSAVLERLPDPLVFGLTKQGHPRHPLYVRGDQRLQPLRWQPTA